jgi:beta-lactam-binding protein with PASTA domain
MNTSMPLRTRVWSFGKLLVLVGALGVTFLVFFGLGMRTALRAREVEVPSLAGKSVSDATEILAGFGLGVRVDENRRTDEKVADGLIVQQDPPAGAQARRQRTVRVWVSSGPRVTTVPVLVGQTERTAQIRLEQDSLEIASLTEFRSPDYPADAVIAQDPPPTSRAKGVSLLINRGEQAMTYVMPDVIGMEGNRVAAFLRSRGFRVSIVGSQPYPGVPPGIVVRQQPAGGFRVAAADAISLEVSR